MLPAGASGSDKQADYRMPAQLIGVSQASFWQGYPIEECLPAMPDALALLSRIASLYLGIWLRAPIR